MKNILPLRITAIALAGASLIGCEFHPRTIQEYAAGAGGHVTVKNVSEDEYWKEQVDQRIAAEVQGEKPDPPHETWKDYWEWWYSVIRRKPKPTWKSKEFKTSEEMINYMKEKRRAKGLPTYE
jgi:hypothetical protein